LESVVMAAPLDFDELRVEPGSKVNIKDWDPSDTSAFGGTEKEALEECGKLVHKLEALQELLYAENKHRVLIILQAMDTGGKDGTVKKVFEGINPQSVRVVHFREPTQEELHHDFLWRVHPQVPENGEIVIFNRSHYEDVLIVRVHKLAPKKVWKGHYRQINDFERMLHEEGTTILKFYLHIDAAEQKKRLEERLADPTKRWKMSPEDIPERKLWYDYMKAYEHMLEKTSTKWAPWHVVPANHKWFRDLVVSSVLVGTLEGLNMGYPKGKISPSTRIP
jgi:PPK2 family polyphosphate:nucleotide phosphotransferase